jgi:F-type H+-transporting ATPase subunit delta
MPDDASREASALALEGAAAALAGPEGASVEAFFRDPAVPKSIRAGALAALYGGGTAAAAAFGRFASLLVEKDRIGLLPEVARTFRSFLDAERGVARLDIASARELGAQALERIGAAWKAAFGAREIVLTTRKDPALLGGFVLRTGSVRYDWSTAGRARRLAKELSRPLSGAGPERGQ